MFVTLVLQGDILGLPTKGPVPSWMVRELLVVTLVIFHMADFSHTFTICLLAVEILKRSKNKNNLYILYEALIHSMENFD